MAQNDDDPNIPAIVRPAPRGSVVDADGRPVPGARVLLYRAVSPWGLDNGVEEEVVCGPDSGFAFSRPLTFKNPAARQASPDYTLFALTPDRALAWAAVLPEVPEDHLSTLVVTPPKPQTYEVVDKTGQPVEGATVWLRCTGDQLDRRPFFPAGFILTEDIGVCRAFTDADGHATLANLPDTTISVAVSKAGFEDETTCTTPRDGLLRFNLRPAAALEGRVTDPSGQPVAGATVSLFPKFRFYHFFVARTDADGRYRIDKIWSDREAHPDQPDWGKYEVALRDPRFTAATREVACTSGQTIRGFDLAALPGTEVIGRLLDPATRAPVVGAEVLVGSASGRQGRITDADGGFRCRVMPGEIHASFSGPPRGCYVVDGGDRRNGLPNSVRTHAHGERFPVELFLPGPLGRLGTVRGRMETPDGCPVALGTVAPVIDGPRLRLTGWSGNALRGVQTDERGVFELRDIPIGQSFTLSGQTADGRFRGSLAGRLEADALDLPAPLILRETVPAEVLLTDIHGQPRPDLAVAVVPIVNGTSLWTQRRELRSGPDGVLRLPDAALGGIYAVFVPGPGLNSWLTQAEFTVSAAADAMPVLRSALVISDQCLVRLLGTNDRPIGIKAFRDFQVELQRDGQTVKWSNGPLIIAGRSGTDVLVSRQTLGARGSDGGLIRFLIETETGNVVRAHGVASADDSGCIVARVTEAFPADAAPDLTVTNVGAEEIAGRVVGPDGTPVAGVRAAFFVQRFLPDDTAPALSGADGVFRLPMRPGSRHDYLTLSIDGWAPVFLTGPPVGRGFRVTLQNTTRLRGTVGGETPGRVELRLEKNKFTPRADSLNHEVRGIQFHAATDAQGTYDFPMEPGKYRWTARSADGRFARGECTLDAGQTLDLGASLRRGHDVVLELRDCQTGEPVPGIEVCIMESIGPAAIANQPGSDRTSDADGRLRWENLPPGETRFESRRMRPARLPGQKQSPYARWWRADAMPADHAGRPTAGRGGLDFLRVNVGDDMPALVRVELERGVRISGFVADSDGKGLAGVEIGLNTEGGPLTGDSRWSTRTDDDGSFLAYLPAGNGLAYRLCAYFPPWNEVVPAANAVSERFDSRPGDERTFRLTMGRGGFFTGRLVGADGQPAGGFKLTAIAADGMDSPYAARIVTAGMDGRFRLGPLRPGQYNVHPGTGAGAPLRKLAGADSTSGDIAADSDTPDLGDIVLPAGAWRRD